MRPHIMTEIHVRLRMAETALTAATIVGQGTELATELTAARDLVRQLLARTLPPALS